MHTTPLHPLTLTEIGHSWSLPGGDELYESHNEKRDQLLDDEQEQFSPGGLIVSAAEMRVHAWFSDQAQSMFEQFRVDCLDAEDRVAADTFFLMVRDTICKNPLYLALRSMPMGGVLHLHVGSSTSTDWVVKVAVQFPGRLVYWPSDVGITTERAAGFSLFFFPQRLFHRDTSRLSSVGSRTHGSGKVAPPAHCGSGRYHAHLGPDLGVVFRMCSFGSMAF